MKTLSVENLNAFYGKAQVLHDVNLTVRSTEIVSIIGPNGAGKTSILKSIAGSIVSNGVVRVDQQEIHSQPSFRRVTFGIGFSPEGRRLFGELPVYKNLMLGAYSRSNREEIETDLQRVYQLFPRLKERSAQQASTLSGGEQQMVAVGRALMSRPSILMLDEPSVGIAAGLKEMLFSAVKAISNEGVGILIVEQDVKAVMAISDRTYVVESGRVVASGPSVELSQDDALRQSFFGI